MAAGAPGSRSAGPAAPGATRWRIALTAEARRGLHRLPGRVAAAIDAFLTGPLAADPAAVSVPLRNELTAYRSARRGDYRVLVRLDERARTVLAVRVSHRADAYRPKRNQ
ncbi:type II toxin-antitoxin system mRNA interferase RelE [Pseudonocardia eucalypti]|uniref:Type II toxin-antitoxin system mRNA interferase RelE n=1 Tax=Pseudonocardia eucalypti TaxID=648755 RepID=A0ABP9QYL7_9PSEU|nr:mRNA-degrading endonuclease RelE of RelBE toxin-antitoxin system [Pseudonocardia eucalypti]